MVSQLSLKTILYGFLQLYQSSPSVKECDRARTLSQLGMQWLDNMNYKGQKINTKAPGARKKMKGQFFNEDKRGINFPMGK